MDEADTRKEKPIRSGSSQAVEDVEIALLSFSQQQLGDRIYVQLITTGLLLITSDLKIWIKIGFTRSLPNFSENTANIKCYLYQKGCSFTSSYFYNSIKMQLSN